MDPRTAARTSLLCAFYFANVDHFIDGDEEDVIRTALNDHSMNINLIRMNYEQNGLEREVLTSMRNAPYRVREEFARLGCAICAAKGFIRDEEKERILRWVR